MDETLARSNVGVTLSENEMSHEVYWLHCESQAFVFGSVIVWEI